MSTESFIISAGCVIVVVAIAIVAIPFLQNDMRRTVERGSANDNEPDITSITLMAFGAALALGVPATGGWLWSVWA